MKLRFEVQGSAAEPYVVIIERAGDNLSAFCDCPAGSNGQSCKHRLNLFEGKSENLVGGDVDKVALVPQLLAGTDVERAWRAVEDADAEAAKAKKRLSAAKKALAKAMHD